MELKIAKFYSEFI